MRKAFSSSDATISMFGQVIEDWVSIKYSYKLAAVKNKTGNNKYTSYSTGDETEECTFEVYQSVVRMLEKKALSEKGTSKISALDPCPVAITYFNEDNEEVTDVVTLKLLGTGNDLSGGADALKCELDNMVISIDVAA